MIFRQLFDKESSTYTYLIADDRAGEAALVDSVVEHVDRDLKLVAVAVFGARDQIRSQLRARGFVEGKEFLCAG